MLIGCIADDFTGASDIASFFRKGGLKTALTNGVPAVGSAAQFDAVVIALKTRTMPVCAAVEESLAAVRWLRAQAAEHIYIKYCSTFDSTPTGNIGPITDAVMDELNCPYTILCPALPVNGRVVKNGQLFVNGVPLDESPMKNHPLTPMWDSHIDKLMEHQGKYPCLSITEADYDNGMPSIRSKIQAFQKTHERFYIVPDFEKNSDADLIAGLFGELPVLTGGSGIAESLAHIYQPAARNNAPEDEKIAGKTILLAGSCSAATLSQISYFRQHGGKSIKMEPSLILNGKQTAEGIWEQVKAYDEPVLVYSSETAENVRKAQQLGINLVSGTLEACTAELACLADKAGYTHIIVAGGETSGAVIKALGYPGYEIGDSVAPGVPIMTPTTNRNLRLVLKSGNFGTEDFFTKTIQMVNK